MPRGFKAPLPTGRGNTREGNRPEHGAYVGSHCTPCANITEHQLRMAERQRKIDAAATENVGK